MDNRILSLARRVAPRLHARGITAAAALVAMPVAVAAIRVLSSDFVATGDIAATELRVRDVFTHPTAYGAYSRFGWHHPGPALFWLLAPGYAASGSQSWTLPITICAVNIACIAVIVHKLRQRFGRGGAVAAAIPLVVFVGALGPSIYASVWNPDVIALPFVVFLLWCIDIAEGCTRSIAPALVVGTFMVQAHVGAAIPATIVLLAAAVGWFVARRHRGAVAPPERGRRRTQLLAFCVAAMWAPPIVEQILYGKDGNLARLWDFATQPKDKLGIATATRAVAANYSLDHAAWLGRRALNPFSGEDLAWYTWQVPVALIVLIPLLACAHARLARFRVPIKMAIVANLAAVIGVSQISGSGYTYLYRWFDATVATTFALGAAAAVAIAAPRIPSLLRPKAIAAVIIALFAFAVVDSRAALRWDPRAHAPMALVENFSALIRKRVPNNTPLEVTSTGGLQAAIAKTAIVLDLEKHDYDVSAPRDEEIIVGPDRITHDKRQRILLSTEPLTSQRDLQRYDAIGAADELSPTQRAAYKAYVSQVQTFAEHNDIDGLRSLGPPPKSGIQYYAYISRVS